VWEDPTGERRLAAYVQLREPLSTDKLWDALQRQLPDYMVPSAIVPLERIPVTTNGKVDLKALPPLDRVVPPEHVAPRNDVESTLASIWADLFGVESVGVMDDFFALGGHSLLATRMLARVNEAFSLSLPLRRVFEYRTVAQLAVAIQSARDLPTKPEPSIVRVRRVAVAIPGNSQA